MNTGSKSCGNVIIDRQLALKANLRNLGNTPVEMNKEKRIPVV